MSQLTSSVWFLAAGLLAVAVAAIVVFARRRDARPAKRSPSSAEAAKNRSEGVFQKRQEILSTLSSDMSSLLLRSRLEVQHLMSPRVKRVSPQTTRTEIESLMGAAQVRHLMVCREHGQLVGVISDRDFQQRRGPTAAEIMTTNPATVSAHTPIGQVITMMVDRKISCVPVVDDGGLHGVLTTTDLLLARAVQLAAVRAAFGPHERRSQERRFRDRRPGLRRPGE